jgi:hypothetical protein
MIVYPASGDPKFERRMRQTAGFVLAFRSDSVGRSQVGSAARGSSLKQLTFLDRQVAEQLKAPHSKSEFASRSPDARYLHGGFSAENRGQLSSAVTFNPTPPSGGNPVAMAQTGLGFLRWTWKRPRGSVLALAAPHAGRRGAVPLAGRCPPPLLMSTVKTPLPAGSSHVID